jgi:hypothetical protein
MVSLLGRQLWAFGEIFEMQRQDFLQGSVFENRISAAKVGIISGICKPFT